MGVQFNLKDEAAVALARRLAERTGRTVTRTIRDALEREEQQYNVLQREKRRRMDAYLAEVDANLNPEWRGKTTEQLTDGMYRDGEPLW